MRFHKEKRYFLCQLPKDLRQSVPLCRDPKGWVWDHRGDFGVQRSGFGVSQLCSSSQSPLRRMKEKQLPELIPCAQLS